MPTVTLKTDNHLHQQISQMAEELHVSKSELIRKALTMYQQNLAKNKIKHSLQNASLKVRDVDASLNNEFDALSFDGLNDV